MACWAEIIEQAASMAPRRKERRKRSAWKFGCSLSAWALVTGRSVGQSYYRKLWEHEF